jgi:acetoin utilization deacetylase AcuC-like enzyme
MINDFAVAIRAMQKRGRIRRAMTVDCDVHQGNGTAFIFGSAGRQENSPASEPPATRRVSGSRVSNLPSKDVFTISLHQENNYPYFKPTSSIDVSLRDGCSDAEYLAWLDIALSNGLGQFEPELICYVAGADPYREDQLGGLDLTIEGLKQRDEMVFRAARARNIPVMVTLAGGYAIHLEDTVTIHCNTVLAAEVYRTASVR